MTLMPVAEARARILEGVAPLDIESVSVFDAGKRVLAADLRARLTQPPFNASAMDGYAVRAADVAHAPVSLTLIGASAAGHAFNGSLKKGQAVRIFTGASLPEGSDTVIIQENTTCLGPDKIKVNEGAPLGRFVRPCGYDFNESETLLSEGQILQSRHLMLAAAMNFASAPVRRKPIVAVLATGDELVPPGGSPGPDQIISSVPAGMKAALERWGAKPLLLGIALDTRESLADLIDRARDADILLTIGGASVGEHDLVRDALENAGARFDVLRVAMKPGKPVMFGLRDRQRVLSLPGNPVSAIICARVFLKPLIDKLLGLRDIDAVIERRLAGPIKANGEREHYMRAKTHTGSVEVLTDQDSSLMKLFVNSDCLVVREPFAPELPKGAPVRVILLDF